MTNRRKVGRVLLPVLMAVGAVAHLTVQAQASVTDPPGYYHLKVTTPIGTCIHSNYTAPGTQLTMHPCLNTDFEEWMPVTVPVPGDRYGHCGCTQATMFLNKAMDLCMAVANNTDTRPVGTPVVQQPCDEYDEKQLWLIHKDGADIGGGARGYYMHPFTLLDKALDVQGGSSADGTPVQVYPANSTAAQLWGAPAGPSK